MTILAILVVEELGIALEVSGVSIGDFFQTDWSMLSISTGSEVKVSLSLPGPLFSGRLRQDIGAAEAPLSDLEM